MYGMPCGYKNIIFSQGCYWKARLSMSRCVWLLILVESSFSHMHIQGIATFTFWLTILVCACVVHKRCHNLIVSECPRMKKDLNEVREWVSVCKCMCDDKIMSCGSIWHAFYSVYRAKGRASASTYPTSLENTTTKFPHTVTTADLSCTAWWNRVSIARVSTYLLDLLEYIWTRLLCSQRLLLSSVWCEFVQVARWTSTNAVNKMLHPTAEWTVRNWPANCQRLDCSTHSPNESLRYLHKSHLEYQ